MFDFASHSGFYGGLSAAVVYVIFMGTWWWYGIRAGSARRLVDTGAAILVDVDTDEDFAVAHVDGARHVPFEELEDRIWQLGTTRRTIVLCCSGIIRGMRAVFKLRGLGYHVVNVGSAFAH